MRNYLVIGIYKDNGQRFAEQFPARTAKSAEEKAKAFARESEKTELEVAAVISGCFKCIEIER